MYRLKYGILSIKFQIFALTVENLHVTLLFVCEVITRKSYKTDFPPSVSDHDAVD